MSHHKFIHNIDDIYKFAQIFNLTEENLVLCFYLIARRKYYPLLSKQSIIVHKGIIGGSEDFINKLYRSILRLETPIGSYTDNDDAIPDEAFALYCLLNPKDTIKALSKTLSKCVDSLTDNTKIPNGYKLYRTELCNTNSKFNFRNYKQIDLDTKDIDNIRVTNELIKNLNLDIVISVETRGGFHIIYADQNDKTVNKQIFEFKQKTKFTKTDVNGKNVTDFWFSIGKNSMVIVPGVYQGGFATRIITLDEWLSK